jgi:hypothetical protein
MTTPRKPAVMMAGMSSAKGGTLGALGAAYLEAFARILDHASEDGC